MKLSNFNPKDHGDFQGELAPIPEGRYLVVIEETKEQAVRPKPGEKPTAATYLQFVLAVVEDGPHKGRKLFANLNLNNPNPQAMQIAKTELASIMRAVRMDHARDSSELHGLKLIVDVKLRKRKDLNDGTMSNRIVGYYKKDHKFEDAPPPVSEATVAPWKTKKEENA